MSKKELFITHSLPPSPSCTQQAERPLQLRPPLNGFLSPVRSELLAKTPKVPRTLALPTSPSPPARPPLLIWPPHFSSAPVSPDPPASTRSLLGLMAHPLTVVSTLSGLCGQARLKPFLKPVTLKSRGWPNWSAACFCKHSCITTQPHSSVSLLSAAALTLQWPDCTHATETIRPHSRECSLRDPSRKRGAKQGSNPLLCLILLHARNQISFPFPSRTKLSRGTVLFRHTKYPNQSK